MAGHHEAVLKIAQNTIDQINQALWQRRIMLDRPSHSGRGTIAFVGNYTNGPHAVAGQDTWGIDPSYRMTADEWAILADTLHRWRWIKNGALITMHYERRTWQAAGRSIFNRPIPLPLRFMISEHLLIMRYKQAESIRSVAIRQQRKAPACSGCEDKRLFSPYCASRPRSR
jgi:hypothetical protein